MKKKYLKPALKVVCVKLPKIIMVSLPNESVDNITVGSRKSFNRDWYDDDEDDW